LLKALVTALALELWEILRSALAFGGRIRKVKLRGLVNSAERIPASRGGTHRMTFV
jgi:hypothetical protein